MVEFEMWTHFHEAKDNELMPLSIPSFLYVISLSMELIFKVIHMLSGFVWDHLVIEVWWNNVFYLVMADHVSTLVYRCGE